MAKEEEVQDNSPKSGQNNIDSQVQTAEQINMHWHSLLVDGCQTLDYNVPIEALHVFITMRIKCDPKN